MPAHQRIHFKMPVACMQDGKKLKSTRCPICNRSQATPRAVYLHFLLTDYLYAVTTERNGKFVAATRGCLVTRVKMSANSIFTERR